MKQVGHLLKLLRTGQEMMMPKEKRDRRTYTVFGGAALLLIMIPCCVIVGVISYFMTQAMMEAGGKEEGMLFLIQFISACAMIFGLHVMVSEFYFSSDIEYLLPLPIRSHELIFAKFLVTYQAESVMEFMVIFSAYIGYILAIGITPLGVITGLLGTVTLPIVPLVYCGIISMVIMYLFQGIRNRKILNLVMAVLTFALLLGVFLSFRGLEGFSVDTYVESLSSGENSFLKVMNIIFYPGYLLIHAAAVQSWGAAGLYLLLTVLLLAAFLGIANLIYLPGLYSFLSVATKKKEKEAVQGKEKAHSIGYAYFQKELRILVRTPAYVSNCLIVNLIWPVLILVVCLMQRGSHTIEQFINMYHDRNILAMILVLGIFLGIAALATAANSLASSAFTREGAHIDFMKYIPVPYRTQIQVKGAISLLFSIPGYLIDTAVLSVILKLKPGEVLYYILTGSLVIVFITCLGLVLDATHPKLIWEDELNALRGNLNVFFNMAFAILATVVICGFGFLLYLIPHSTIGFIYILYALLLMILDVYMYHYTMKQTVQRLEEL